MEHNIVLNEFKVTHCSLYIKKIDVFSVINFRVYLLGNYFFFISWSTLIYMVVCYICQQFMLYKNNFII